MDWLSGVAENLKVSQPAAAQAVFFIDRVYSHSPLVFSVDELDLVAVTCLMISAKNLDMKYPCAYNLNLHAKQKYSEERIIRAESEVLQAVGWEIFQYTILDLVRFIRQQGAVFTSDTMAAGYGTSVQEVQATHVKNYAEFFIDYCLQQSELLYTDPLHVACSIIAYSRKCVHIAFEWCWELEYITGLGLKTFKPTLELLDRLYKADFPAETRSPEKQVVGTIAKGHEHSASSHNVNSTDCSSNKHNSQNKVVSINLKKSS